MLPDVKLPTSLWLDTAEPGPVVNQLQGDVRADVVIVGAGFTGLRAALVLAEAGVEVAVVEARDIGWGASGRNGGQVNPLLPENTPETAIEKLGQEAGEKMYRLAMQSADELFGLIKKYNIQSKPRQNGWIRVAHGRAAGEQWRRQCESWSNAGVDLEILNRSELEQLAGTSGFSMGALVKAGGAIHPLSQVRGLARVAITAGATIYTRSPANKLTSQSGQWRVHCDKGEIQTDHVLLCTNGYTDSLWPGLKYSIVPLTSVQVASEPLPESARQSILPGGQTISDTRRTILYGRREPEGHFILGTIGQGGDGWKMDFDRVRREAVQLFPQLKDAVWRYQWGGKIAITQNHLPHLHEPAPGLTTGLGFNGRGVAMSHVMGRVLAERVLGKSEKDLPIPITDIKGYPLRRFTGIGIPMAVQWMWVRDRIERTTG